MPLPVADAAAAAVFADLTEIRGTAGPGVSLPGGSPRGTVIS